MSATVTLVVSAHEAIATIFDDAGALRYELRMSPKLTTRDLRRLVALTESVDSPDPPLD